MSLCSCGGYTYRVLGLYAGWGVPWVKSTITFPEPLGGVRHTKSPPQECLVCKDMLLPDGAISYSDKSAEDEARIAERRKEHEEIALRYGKKLSSFTGPPPRRKTKAEVFYARYEGIKRGRRAFEKIARRLDAKGEAVISGEDAFLLHATHGVSIDATLDLAALQGFTVDEEGFERLMEEHRSISRAKKMGLAAVEA